MAKYKNTLQKGSVRYIVFQEGGVWYAAGLEFNIVETGDTPQEATLLLFEALAGYVESAKKIKARPSILNQKPDSEYADMWQSVQDKKFEHQQKVFSAGTLSIGQLLKSFVPA